MSFWRKLFGKPPPSAAVTRPSPTQSAKRPVGAAAVARPAPTQPVKKSVGGAAVARTAPAQPARKPVGPQASRIYIFSTVIMDSDERQEALWGGFFAYHPAVDRRVAEFVPIAGAITYVEPKWRKGGVQLNLEHAAKLADSALDGLFDKEHKGGCYLDAIVFPPEKPTIFVVLVWNAGAASRARQLIPGVKMGITSK